MDPARCISRRGAFLSFAVVVACGRVAAEAPPNSVDPLEPDAAPASVAPAPSASTDGGSPFGEGGVVVTASLARSRDHVASLFKDDAGHLIVAADAESGGTVFARLDLQGRLDPSFGVDGISFDWRARPDAVIRHPDGVMALVDAVAGARVGPDGLPLPGFAPTSKDRARMRRGVSVGDAQGRIVIAEETLDALVLRRILATGALDSSFGDSGEVRIPLVGAHETSLFVDPATGRVLIATALGANTSFFLAAFHDDGSVDQSFGSGGSVVHDVAFTPRGASLLPGPTGTLLLGGVAFDATIGLEVGAARFTASGAIDATYGTNGLGLAFDARRAYLGIDVAQGGVVTVATRTHIHRFALGGDWVTTREICPARATFPVTPCVRRGPVVDANAGISYVSDEDDVVVVRHRDAYNEVDHAFGQDGAFEIPFADRPESVGTLIATNIGDLLAIGDESSALSARYSRTGELVAPFGEGGRRAGAGGPAAPFSNGDVVVVNGYELRRWTPTGSQESWFSPPSMIPVGLDAIVKPLAVAVDSSDRVTLVGTAGGPRGPHGAMARLLGTGVLDPGFAAKGTYDSALDGTSFDRVTSTPRGLVVVGSAIAGARRDLLVARFDTAGNGEASFGTDGVVILDATPLGFERARAVAISPGGVVVAGVAAELASTGAPPLDSVATPGLMLARVTDDGRLDPSFGASGVVTGSEWSGFDARDVAVDASGRIYVAGRWPDAHARGGFAVVRFTAAGQLDRAFGRDGVFAPFDAPSGAATLAIASDGDVYAGGYVLRSPTGRDFALARVE
ncbi:MAG: hypothetical protein U0235_08265 [Polyangiaceae bacterium]